MMKKMTKAALLAAALAFTAGLGGCFVSAVEDDGAGSGSPAQGGGSGSGAVNAVWDFSVASLTAVGVTTGGTKEPKTDNIALKSGSGATLQFTSSSLGKSVKIQNESSGGLNIGSGSGESDMLLITVDDACTLSFTGKGSSGSTSWNSSSVNSFSVAGTTIYERKSADETSSQTWTYKCTAKGAYKIKASGMIFTELKCE